MRKLLLIVFIIFSLTGFAQIPTNGLVGYWPFNNNINDQSGNQNPSIGTGLSFGTDRFGRFNSCLELEGDTISYATAQIPYSQSLTLCFWVKVKQPTTIYSVPYYFRNGSDYTAQGYVLYSGLNSNLFVRLGTTTTSWLNWFDQYLQYNQTDTSWNFISIVVDDINKQISVFKNSLRIGSIGFTGNILNFSHLNFGHARKRNKEERFRGKLDDFRFYNRALDSTEIKSIYNETQCTTIVYDTARISVQDTLVINANLTGIVPPQIKNTFKIYPDPSNSHISIDNGNLSLVSGYQVKITNSIGIQVFQSPINQQKFYIDLSSWTGNGIYFVNIIDGQGNIIEIKKIVLQ